LRLSSPNGNFASTGSCAAAAAAAAAAFWQGVTLPSVVIDLPDSGQVELEIERLEKDRTSSLAAVRKPSNDDPDATRGLLVCVHLTPCEAGGIRFQAGEGVGTVTRPGLQLKVGEAAINPVPRRQIMQELAKHGIVHALVEVSIPGGREIAQRTFNPRLGIEGGLSVLGTAGLVRPFSTQAVIESTRAHLAVARHSGFDRICLVPGHMGERAARALLELDDDAIVEVSNAWGEAVDHARSLGFKKLFIVGHPGKLGKLAQGQWDTHSSHGSTLVPWLRQAAQDWGLTPPMPANTVDDLFTALSLIERAKLANALAHGVAQAVIRRSGLGCEVLLTDYSGTPLGRTDTP
jgi:cobalt-precorrin-5B (C1)-methyltransferase